VLLRDINNVPAHPYGQGAQKRIIFGESEGAPTFAMRVFDVPPGGASSHHAHDFEHEVLILEGNGTIKSDEGDRPFSKGTAIFIPPNERHQLVNTGTDMLRFACMVPLHGEDGFPSSDAASD